MCVSRASASLHKAARHQQQGAWLRQAMQELKCVSTKLPAAAIVTPCQPLTAASSAANPDIIKGDSPRLHAFPQRLERVLIVALLTEQTGPYLHGMIALSSWKQPECNAEPP